MATPPDKSSPDKSSPDKSGPVKASERKRASRTGTAKAATSAEMLEDGQAAKVEGTASPTSAPREAGKRVASRIKRATPTRNRTAAATKAAAKAGSSGKSTSERPAPKSAKPAKPTKRASPKRAGAKTGRSETTVASVLAVPRQKVQSVVAALPEVTPKRAAIAAATTGGVLAAVGAALFLWRASKADQPDYRLVERDGDFEIREYPALVTASTETHGARDAALNRGFDILAGYIFAKSRPGAKIAMTAPVLSDGSNTSRWRTRFIMPPGKARADLPNPPSGVTLESEAPRRAAVLRFSGRVDDAVLNSKEGALRSWLQLRSLPSEGKAEHAFYNSPMMPGPLRRNEVIVTLSTH